MNSSISSYFSRDAMLKRQVRTSRTRKAEESTLCPSSSLRSKPLNIIVEEDESRASSRSPSPMPYYSASTSAGGSQTLGLKAKRRHANVSDIRIARDMVVHDNNDFLPNQDTLLSAPRPAPRPPTTTSSPHSSPDSFKLTFTDVAYPFPHPPIPTPSCYDRSECDSPTSSSLSSSPCSHGGDMPLTPSSSDDESPCLFNPRRAAIQPLVIKKHNRRSSSSFDEVSNDSEPDSDSEWYTREFSKILTLCSPIPPSFPLQQPSRPDSMFISSDIIISAPPASKRRVSKDFLPPCSKRESFILLDDSASPRRRNSKRCSIPKYPPPPVPPIPAHLRSSSVSSIGSDSASPASPCNKTLPHTLPRPPPRSSVPADCVFDLYMDDEDADDDSASAFSFTMYEVDFGEHEQGQASPGSTYSQPSFQDEFSVDDVKFELDYPLMLPLSLPETPIDLEADIAMGLERLRNREDDTIFQHAEFNLEDEEEVQIPIQEEQIPAQEAIQPAPETTNNIFSPVSSAFSLSPPPSAAFYYQAYTSPLPSPTASPNRSQSPYGNEEKMLKSKWSTSTLGSIREEHERRGASSKLRLYFGGQSSAPKSPKRSSGSSKKVPSTPTSPFGLISPRKTSRGQTSPPAAASAFGGRGHVRGNSNSDVMVIGYGMNGAGVRRRGSVTTVSDAGSEESSSSTSSSGLRRKPIPVEMFLRSAV